MRSYFFLFHFSIFIHLISIYRSIRIFLSLFSFICLLPSFFNFFLSLAFFSFSDPNVTMNPSSLHLHSLPQYQKRRQCWCHSSIPFNLSSFYYPLVLYPFIISIRSFSPWVFFIHISTLYC